MIEILEFAAPEMLHAEEFENNSIATQKTNKTTENLYSSQYGFLDTNNRSLLY